MVNQKTVKKNQKMRNQGKRKIPVMGITLEKRYQILPRG